MKKRTTFQQFDLVEIITTRNVTWRTDSEGINTNPNGKWSIVTAYPDSGTLLIQKETALVLIPASDIRKVANFDVETVFEKNDEINKKFLRKKDV